MHRSATQDESMPAGAVSLGRVLWTGWRDYAALASRYQRTVLLSAIYLLVLGPGALLARATGQELLRRTRPGASTWRRRAKGETTLAAMKRQY